MVRLQEFYQDPTAPQAQDVLPAVFAAVRGPDDRILLVRRIDDGNWELPGGRIEVGESVAQTLIREVEEESGVGIELTGLAGVYSDPSHVLVDPGGVVHQQLALCFHAVPVPDGRAAAPRPDGVETMAAAWFDVAEVADLVVHPAVRLRIEDAVGTPGSAQWR